MIIQCPECRTSVSDQSSKCPRCGYPLRSQAIELTDKRYKAMSAYGYVFLFGGFFMMFVNPIFAIGIPIGTIMLFYAKTGAWWNNG